MKRNFQGFKYIQTLEGAFKEFPGLFVDIELGESFKIRERSRSEACSTN